MFYIGLKNFLLMKRYSDLIKEQQEVPAEDSKTVGSVFGTLLQSSVEIHKKHLMTSKYNEHKALDTFYNDMPGLVDAFIENYQGMYGKVLDYSNVITADGKTAKEYLEELHTYLISRQDFFETLLNGSSLSSDIDAIAGLISSTLYQLKELTESTCP